MAKIAQEAGVSVAVVSRLLRGDPTLRISDKRRREVLAVRDRMGPVEVRRRYGKVIVAPVSRTFSYGWIEKNLLGHPLYTAFKRTLEDKGFRLHFDFIDPNQSLRTFSQLMRSPQSCGGLLILHGLATQQLADLLNKNQYPHVSRDPKAERFDINSVDVNQVGAFRLLVEHLARLGHRRIGFVGQSTSDRYPLFGAAMLGNGLTVDQRLFCRADRATRENGQERRAEVRQAVAQWLKGRPAVTALVCENDDAALGVVGAVRDMGLRIGVDLSITGYDNIEGQGEASEGAILTTIDNPGEKIGRRMAELLLNQVLHGQRQIVHERLPAKLIVRKSTGEVHISEVTG